MSEVNRQPFPATASEQNVEDIQALPSPTSQPQYSPSSTAAETTTGSYHHVNENHNTPVAEEDDAEASSEGNGIAAFNSALDGNVSSVSVPYFIGKHVRRSY